LLDASVGDHRDAQLVGDLGDVHDGRHLRHAHARDDARRADGAGTDPDLDGVGAGVDQRPGGLARGDVAGDHVDLVAGLDLLDGLDDVLRVPVRRVDADDIDVGRDQCLDAVVVVDADSGPDAQAPAMVARRPRVLLDTVDVAHRDQARQLAPGVDQQQLLDLPLLEDLLGLFELGVGRTGDEVRLGHHGADLGVVVGQELQIAPRQDADQLLALDDGDAADVLLLHQLLGPADRIVRRERDRIADHAMLAALDLGDLPLLGLDAEILVDDPDAAFLRQRDGQRRLGHGVHGCRDDGDIDLDVPGQGGARVRLARHEVALGGDQQDVIKRNPFRDDFCTVHEPLQQGLLSSLSLDAGV